MRKIGLVRVCGVRENAECKKEENERCMSERAQIEVIQEKAGKTYETNDQKCINSGRTKFREILQRDPETETDTENEERLLVQGCFSDKFTLKSPAANRKITYSQ